MNRNVWLIFLCQALSQAVTMGQVAMSALIGHALAGDKFLATLPYAIQMAATMAASIPAGMIFARLTLDRLGSPGWVRPAGFARACFGSARPVRGLCPVSYRRLREGGVVIEPRPVACAGLEWSLYGGVRTGQMMMPSRKDYFVCPGW